MTRKQLASTIFALALPFGAAHAATTTINAGGSSLVGPTYIAEFQAYTAAHTNVLFSYEAVGSGGAQKAFLNNDITQFEPPNVTSSTLTYGTIAGTQVDIGANDVPLTSSQFTNASTGSYGTPPEGSASDGPLIQIPTFGVPIAVAYNESGATSTLKLTDAQICGVFSGQITDWHSLVSTIPAGKKTIEVVYFSNSSGTTYLFTQHLAAVCNSSNSTFPSYPVPITKYYVSSTASNKPVFATAPANFIGANASSAAATALLGTLNSVGYLSPDFTSIAPKSASTTTLKVASLKNATDGAYYQPTVANTEKGLAHAGAGSTDTTPPATLAAAMDPVNWFPTIPVTTAGYPIVGYGGLDISTCYANAKASSAIVTFLTDQYNTSAYKTIITNNGFSPLINTAAEKYIGSVNNVFLTNKSGYNLNIGNATTCTGLAGR